MGCAEEPASIRPDGGAARPDAGDAGGGGSPTARVDGGIDAGRDAARPDAGNGGDEDDDADDEGPDAGAGDSLALTSPDITAGELLPAEHRCDGAVSPALSWSPGPDGTRSYAVQLRATSARATIKSFWVLFDIPSEVTEIPRDLPREERVDIGSASARQALDDSRLGDYGYYGPCTDTSLALTVHALDVEELPDITDTSTATEINAAIAEHEIGKSTIEARAAALESR